MSIPTNEQAEVIEAKLSFRPASRRAPELLREYIATHRNEELAERLTTYQPGIPHHWFGRPVSR